MMLSDFWTTGNNFPSFSFVACNTVVIDQKQHDLNYRIISVLLLLTINYTISFETDLSYVPPDIK